MQRQTDSGVWQRPGALLGLLVLAGCLGAACHEPPGGQAPPPVRHKARVVPAGSTVVTFTFADTRKSQLAALPLFGRHGMHASFYLNSGRVGAGSSYLSLEDVQALAAAGHEVASHTIDHEDLTNVSLAEARRQICDDRANLMALGFPVTSFAYPFSSDTPEVRAIVIECNFNNARATGGIKNPYGCSSCPPAETLPPQDVFVIRTPPSIRSNWTLEDLQSLVLQAEAAGGGYLQISLHEICEGCGTYAIREALLESFLAWLAPRAERGTFVMTTHELIGGALKPPVLADGGTFDFDAGVPDAGAPDAGVPDAGAPDAGAPDAGAPDAGAPDAGAPDAGAPDAGVNLLPNPSLETDANSDNVPDCWKRLNTGSTSGGWSRTSDAHSGSWAQKARISSYTRGDRRLVVLQDMGTCAPVVTPGHGYRVSAWYKTEGTAVFVATYRTSSGWRAWAESPVLPASASYTLAEWTTPPMPEGALNVSVGLALRSVGSLTMDDFTLVDLTAEPAPSPAPAPTPETLLVMSPNGGESLGAGTLAEVRWASSGPWERVSLSYSTNGGVTWRPIVVGAPNTGRYAWPVPATPTDGALLRLSSYGPPFVEDLSDAPFTLLPPAAGP